MILDDNVIVQKRMAEEVDFQNKVYKSVEKLIEDIYNCMSSISQPKPISWITCVHFLYRIVDISKKPEEEMIDINSILLTIDCNIDKSKNIRQSYRTIRDNLHLIRKNLKSTERIVI